MGFLIGIGGGIGAGKSVVARICRLGGYKVYDCDLKAKKLMTCDVLLREKISNLLGINAYLNDGSINKEYVASSIFSDETKRIELNRYVHKAVIDDIIKWREDNNDPILFVESALLFTSGLNKIVDEIWIVESPHKLKVNRIINRDSITNQQVLNRIKSQYAEEELYKKSNYTYILNNEEDKSLYCQIINRISLIKEKYLQLC